MVTNGAVTTHVDVIEGAGAGRTSAHAAEHDPPQGMVGLAVPPRSRRWRTTLPDEASSGATSHRWVQAASERMRSGLSPAATSKMAAVSTPTP